MSQYSEADIAKIINDCEILILPDDQSIEEVLASENQRLLNDSRLKAPEEIKDDPWLQLEDDEEEFDRIFQSSKHNKLNASIPEPTDFSRLFHTNVSTSAEQKPNPERAVDVNRLVKDRLTRFRSQIIGLIEKIDAKFKANNIFLEQAKSSDGKDASSFKTSYIQCGAPFFKDALSYPAPFNDDYKHRKNINKEFFPFDMPTTSSRWKTKEKVALVNGVKNQMISHIKSKQSRRLCEDTRKTRGKLQKLKFISNSKDLENSPVLEIYESIQNDHPEFVINWNLISFDNLQSMHSVSECMGMWYSYLRPDLNREPFTEEEDVAMANAMVENSYSDWNELASMLNRRSALQTFVNFHVRFSRLCPSNVRWTEAEDAKLMEATEKHSLMGIINWGKVGNSLPARNKTQCYNRHMIIMKSQGTKKGVFSRQEDRSILEFVTKNGEKAFKDFPKDLLPGRTLVQIRNHYNVALKHQGTVHPWTREEDKTLIEYVEKHGTNNWTGIATILATHNRISCRTRFLTISKYLANHPNGKLEDVPCKTKTLTAVQKAASRSDDEEKQTQQLVKSRNCGEKTFDTFKRRNENLYRILRTAFNFDLGAREITADNKKLLILMKLFKAEDYNRTLARKSAMFTGNQFLKLSEAIEVGLDEKLTKELKIATMYTQFLMPPNFNTAAGLRAITVRLNEDKNDEYEDFAVENPSVKYKNALENFQKLYFSLFYWSAMISKLDTDDLSDIHFSKYPRSDMTATEIFRKMSKRRLPVSTNSKLEENKPKVYPPSKKQKLVKVI